MLRCKYTLVSAVEPEKRMVGWLVRAAPELAPAAGRHEGLESILVDAVARGRAAWPSLAVAPETFVTTLAIAVRGNDDLPDAIAELAVEDLWLAQACATGEPAALDAFEAACTPTLSGALRKMGLAPDVIEEVLQQVRAKLFVAADGQPKIATYSGRAPLTSWVRTIATRVALDRLRRDDSAFSDDDALASMPDASDTPELAHFREQYRAEFKLAFEAALATLDVRERNVLRHHFVDGLTTEEIGTLYGVHKTTAFRWLESARVVLSKRTRANFCQRVKVVPSELESILRLVQSQIDLSLSRVLVG